MPRNDLDVSDAGLKAIIGHEAEIDGLYNDSSGYYTFGIGHLAHDKTRCYLLEAAKGDPSLKSLVHEKIFSKKHKLSYVPRGAVASDKYATLSAHALERAKADVSGCIACRTDVDIRHAPFLLCPAFRSCHFLAWNPRMG